MNIVVKKSFLDKENKNERVVIGQPLSVSKERGDKLIQNGFAVAGSDEEAKDLKAAANETATIGKRK